MIANLTGLDRVAVGTAPIQARPGAPVGAQEASTAGFAGLLSLFLGGSRPALAEPTAGTLVRPVGDALAAGSRAQVSDGAPAGLGFFLPEGITDVYALATTGRPQPGLDVGRVADAPPQAVAGTDSTGPAQAAGKVSAARSDLLADLLPLVTEVAAGAEAVRFRAVPEQLPPQGQATAAARDALLPRVEIPAAPGQKPEAGSRPVGETDLTGRKLRPAERPTSAISTGPSLGERQTSSLARTVISRPGMVVHTSLAVDSDARAASGQARSEAGSVDLTGRDTQAGARAPRPVAGSESNPGQTASGGDQSSSGAPADTPGQRRQLGAARFDTLDSTWTVAPTGGSKVDGKPADGSRPQTEHVMSAVLERVESAKAAGREEARFEIRTADGQAIDVKIAVHRNAVWARIGVSSTEMREALACRIWELGQQLESGGLTPESIEVVLLGGWSEGSHQGGQRRPPRQRAGDLGQDPAAATLVEAERHEFEHWA